MTVWEIETTLRYWTGRHVQIRSVWESDLGPKALVIVPFAVSVRHEAEGAVVNAAEAPEEEEDSAGEVSKSLQARQC